MGCLDVAVGKSDATKQGDAWDISGIPRFTSAAPAPQSRFGAGAMARRLLCTMLAAAALALASGSTPPSMPSSTRATPAASSATPVSSPTALPFRSSSLNASSGSSKNDTQTAAAIAASERLSQTAAASKWPAVTPLPPGRRKVLIYDFDDTLKNGAQEPGVRTWRENASLWPTWDKKGNALTRAVPPRARVTRGQCGGSGRGVGGACRVRAASWPCGDHLWHRV